MTDLMEVIKLYRELDFFRWKEHISKQIDVPMPIVTPPSYPCIAIWEIWENDQRRNVPDIVFICCLPVNGKMRMNVTSLEPK